MNRSKLLNTIKVLFISIVAIFIVSYGFFSAHKYIMGPKISLLKPDNWSLSQNNIIEIEGNIKNANATYINNNVLYIDKNGDFKNRLLLNPGYNVLSIKARDRFGKEKSLVRHVYLSLNH